MATILQCVRHRPPTGFESGSAPASYSAQWRVEIDDEVAFIEMLRLARNVVTAGVQRAIPRKGETFRWDSFGGTTTKDLSAIALDFDCTELLDDGKTWIVQVRWRQPVPGSEEEPKRVQQTRDPGQRRDPDKREPYRWIEYFTEVRDVTEAINLRKLGQDVILRPRFTKGVLATAAGEEVEKAQNEVMHSVFVTERNVKNQLVAHRINEQFTGAINSDSFRHPMIGLIGSTTQARNLGRRLARFLRAETSQYPFWESGQEWYKMQIRLEIKDSPFQVDVPNRGILFFNPSTSTVDTNRDNDGVVQMTNLTLAGERLALSAQPPKQPIIIPYVTHRIVSFESLSRFL